GTGPEDIHMWSGNVDAPFVRSKLRGYWHSQGGFANTFGWKGDTKLDQLIDQISVEMDEAKRKDVFREIQKYFDDNVLLVPTVSYPTPQVIQPYIHQMCSNLSGQMAPRCSWDTWID